MKNKFFAIVIALLSANLLNAQYVQEDKELGREANRQIIAQIGLFEHSSKDVLDDIGYNLVDHIADRKFDYQFAILNMSDPNAMALPGGYVYFSRGILALANTPDELAGVMGHEITHVHNQHSRKASHRGMFGAILQIPGALVGLVAPGVGQAINTPIALGSELVNSSYSRGHEKEADLLGAQLAAGSGYDPTGLRDMLHKISLDVEISTGEEEKSSWFDSHPYTPKRVEDLNKLLEKIDYTEASYTNEEHRDFIKRLEGLVVGDDPAMGIFRDGKFLHPDMGLAMSYPQGWLTMNSPSMLGFMSPDGKAQLVFTITPQAADPSDISKNFMADYYEHYSLPPARNEAVSIKGFPGHIIQFEQESKQGKIIATMLWFNMLGRTYQFMEVSEEGDRNASMQMAESIRQMTPKERQSIYQTLIKVEKANEGESLEAFSKRTGNVLDIKYLAMINNLEVDAVLSGDRWLKIGEKVKY